MKWSLEGKVIAGLLAGLCILMIVGVVAYHSTVRFLEVTDRRAQTHLVLEKLEKVLSHITDTETGVRGYIVTGKKRFLEPYQDASNLLTQERLDLRELLRGFPDQRQQLDALETVVDRYLTLANQQILLRRNRPFDESLEELYMDAEKSFMDQIRASSDAMKQAVSTRLADLDRDVVASSRQTIAAIVAGSVLACGIVILAMAIVKRDLSVRRRVELERLKTQSLLNAIVEHIPAMLFVKDARDHRFVQFNKAGEELLGYSRHELIGKNDYDFFPTNEAEFFVTKDREVVEGGRMVDIPEEPINTRYKGMRTLHTKKVPIFGEDGKPEYLLGISEDITEQKRIDAERDRLSKHNLLLLESSGEGIYGIDLQGICTFINTAGAAMLGYSPQDIVGKPTHELFHHHQPDGRTYPDAARPIQQVLTSGKGCAIEDEVLWRHDGSPVSVAYTAAPIIEDGLIKGAVVTFVDITERRRAEAALRESEERFHLAAQGANTGIWDWDLRTNKVHFSDLWKGMLGYAPHEVRDEYSEWESRLHPDDRERIISAVQAYLGGSSQHYEMEYRLRHKDGSYRWILARGIAMRDEHGKAYRMAGSHVDITRRAEAEEAWKLSQAFARNIIASSLDMIIVVDKDRRIVEFNPAAQDAFGYRAEDVLGQVMDVLYVDPRLSEHMYVTAMQQGRYVHEVLNRRKDGSEFVGLLSASVLRDGTGHILGVMSVSRDITEHKRAVAELRKAKEAAEAANQAKTEFLASMSHEIRTPMNAIIGMADLLWETPLMPEQQEYVGIFRRAGVSLLNLLNDILDLSKVEAGYLELEHIEFDLQEVIDKTSEMMALRAHEKGLELGCSIAPDVAVDLIGDPNRLRQVLLNLLGNAIKFTEKGEVALRIVQDPDIQEPGALCFMVTDTGIGIPAEKLKTVFERFVQADSSTTRKYGGTGLGLTISKRLVDLMGGRIWVESKEGKGSVFSFTARFTPQTHPRRRYAVPDIDLTGVKTLVADDNATNRLILKEALSSWGALVTEVAGGEAALLELMSHWATAQYQLVLLDCRMPDLSGFDVVQRFMERSPVDGMTVMVLTSDSRSADIAKSYKLGLGGYLVKPIRRSDLHKAITIAMNRTKGLGTSVPALHGIQRKDRSLNILLVEDSADNVLLIRSYLQKATCHIDHVENGQAAFERFQVCPYDLVLMDMHMPVMDGYTATGHIRRWERQRGREPIPILALTAFGMKEEEQKSLNAGCTAHLVKPIRKATLLAAIAQYARSIA